MAKKTDKGNPYAKFDVPSSGLPDDDVPTTIVDPETAQKSLAEALKGKEQRVDDPRVSNISVIEEIKQGEAKPPTEDEIAQHALDAEMAKVQEERLNQLMGDLAGTRLTGRELPKVTFKEGTPEEVSLAHALLIDLQIGGSLKPYDVVMARRVNSLILQIEDNYSVKGG